MFLMTLYTTLINILALGPVGEVFAELLLFVDKGIYSLVRTSFTVFIIMTQLNLNVIYDMASPLVDRLKALVIVFIIFKVGVALVKYMLSPEEVLKGSKKLLINILICAALLVSCNFVFNVFNELSMMIVGKPRSYHYTVLKQIANADDGEDAGLLMRLFFGTKTNFSNGNMTTAEGIGNSITYNTLCALFPDKDKTTCKALTGTISDGSSAGYSIKRLPNIASKLDVTIDGYPGVALILGLYIVYSIVKAAIEIGTRMFKLMLMQLIAPIAIISIASDKGVESKPFSSFIKMYLSIYVSAFTRIAAILLVTVFVSKVFTQLDTIADNISSTGYGTWILIICIVAGYRFAGEIPKMVDKIFETHLGENPDKGFGKFLSTMIAMPALAAAGTVGGAIGAESFGAGLYGAAAGALGGLYAGFRGNTISEKLKNFKSSQQGIDKTQASMAAAGGVPAWIEGKLEGTRAQDRTVREMDERISEIDQFDKTADTLDKQVKENMKKGTHTYGAGYRTEAGLIEFGTNKDTYAASVVKTNKDYSDAVAAVQKFSDPSCAPDPSTGKFTYGGVDYATKEEARRAAETARDAAERAATKEAKDAWEAQYETTLTTPPTDSGIAELKDDYQKSAEKIGLTKTTPPTKRSDITDGKDEAFKIKQPLERDKRAYVQRGQYKANHGKNS